MFRNIDIARFGATLACAVLALGASAATLGGAVAAVLS